MKVWPGPTNPNNPQVSNAETDKTGFGSFVTMPLGIFVESSRLSSTRTLREIKYRVCFKY
jgi:hypothetical protein